MDKIKAAAKTKGSEAENDTGVPSDGKKPAENEGTNRSSWGALKDDYMLGSKKVSEEFIMLSTVFQSAA